MSDIREAEQAVITAARGLAVRLRSLYGDPVDNTADFEEQELDRAVDALDRAMNPDPWRLLECASLAMMGNHSHAPLKNQIDAALKLRGEAKGASNE